MEHIQFAPKPTINLEYDESRGNMRVFFQQHVLTELREVIKIPFIFRISKILSDQALFKHNIVVNITDGGRDYCFLIHVAIKKNYAKIDLIDQAPKEIKMHASINSGFLSADLDVYTCKNNKNERIRNPWLSGALFLQEAVNCFRLWGFDIVGFDAQWSADESDNYDLFWEAYNEKREHARDIPYQSLMKMFIAAQLQHEQKQMRNTHA